NPNDEGHCRRGFSWNGQYSDAASVINLAGGQGAAMNSSPECMAAVIRANPVYTQAYFDAFGDVGTDNTLVFNNLGLAFEAYFRKLISINSPFDQYLAGSVGDDSMSSAYDKLSDAQRRGLAVFIGKGLCVDCHRGPLLSDLAFHNTGVPQRGLHVP